MKKSLFRKILPWLVIVVVVVGAYFANVEVQSYLGRQALEKTGLVSVPLEEAFLKAKNEKKLVLVNVSAIWCPNCRNLDEKIFSNDIIRNYIKKNIVFSRLEYESEEGKKFLEKYQAEGFPNLWLLDSEGKVVKKLKVTFNVNEFLAEIR